MRKGYTDDQLCEFPDKKFGAIMQHREVCGRIIPPKALVRWQALKDERAARARQRRLRPPRSTAMSRLDVSSYEMTGAPLYPYVYEFPGIYRFQIRDAQCASVHWAAIHAEGKFNISTKPAAISFECEADLTAYLATLS